MGERTERAKSTIKDVVAPDAAASQARGTVTAPLGTSENPSHAIFTLANIITFCRLLLTIAFLALFVRSDGSTRTLALVLYTVAACTDFLDGQIARRTQTVSWAGKVMDPIMDRVLLFTGVLGLMLNGELPIWVALFVVGRDVYLGIAAACLRKYRRRPLDVIYVGKVATACLMTGFVLMLISKPEVQGLFLAPYDWLIGFNGQTCPVGIYFVYVGVVCSAIAAVIYSVQGFSIRHDVLKARGEL